MSNATVTTDDLLMLIGAKEAELFGLRHRIAELEAQANLQIIAVPPDDLPPDAPKHT